jgi:hypothetical protein
MSYRPQQTITGPAYSRSFQRIATVITLVLVIYGLSVATRFPLLQYSIGVLWLLGGMSLLLVTTWWFFLHSTVTIDQTGLRQTWIFDKKVEWRDVRSARLLGVPLLHRLLPPRLMLRTSTGFFITFQGGTPELLAEYARIAMAFDVTRHS